MAITIPDKQKSGFNATEFIIVFIVLFLIVISIKVRYGLAVDKSEVAQARKNLRTICQLEKTYHVQHGHFGDLNQINFQYPNSNHSFEYSITIYEEGDSFDAVAHEKEGMDPLGNNVPGDQQLTIKPNGLIY